MEFWMRDRVLSKCDEEGVPLLIQGIESYKTHSSIFTEYHINTFDPILPKGRIKLSSPQMADALGLGRDVFEALEGNEDFIGALVFEPRLLDYVRGRFAH